MPHFSQRSIDNLATCHPDLQKLFNEVIKYFDCVVVCGHRNKEDQEKAFAEGNTKLHWPYGRHNQLPSLAADVYAYPINENDDETGYFLAGFVKAMAVSLGIELRLGADWDGDNNIHNQSFFDICHFELPLND